MAAKFWSDLHLGHHGVLKYRPKFKTQKEHDEYILDTLSKSIGPRTSLRLLGDIAISREALGQLKKVLSDTHTTLYLGNHDCERDGIRIVDLLDVYDDIQSLGKQRGHNEKFWLSHCPVHVEELRGKRNIHGHVHLDSIKDSRFINVSFDVAEKGPVTLEQICYGVHNTYD